MYKNILNNIVKVKYEVRDNHIFFPKQNLSFYILDLKLNSEFFNKQAKKTAINLYKSTENRLVVFEDEIEDKFGLIVNMLNHRLMYSDIKYRASNLTFKVIDKPIKYKDFFNNNHLDGYTRSTFMFGLFDKETLISAMSFRKSWKDKCWELARFCTKSNVHVYGAASKMLKHWNLDKLISFSNNRLSNGRTYELLNFKEITKTTEPSYYYTDFVYRLWRFKCKRINSPEIIKYYPTETSQALGGIFSNIYLGHNLPIYKIYDLGHRKWELT